MGNPVEALDTVRRDSLSSLEFRGFIDLLPARSTREKKAFVLQKPRLGPRGNRIQEQLSHLPGQVSRRENRPSQSGRGELAACDSIILSFDS